MIIDMHTHTFPKKIADRAVSSLSSTSGLTPSTNGRRTQLIESMDKCGIAFSLLLPVATSGKMVESLNNAAIENNSSDRFVSFGAMHPAYGDSGKKREELQRIKAAGIKGVKLHADYMKRYIDDGEMLEIMKLCAKEDLIVTLHMGVDLSFCERVRCTPERLSHILPLLGEGKVVCAHMGGVNYSRDTIRYLRSTGVYFDTSAMTGMFKREEEKGENEELKRLFDAIDIKRIMFASDSPWSAQSDCIRDVKALHLSAEDEEAVMSLNAKALLSY
ncbi:MAG: amidohydrolase family protein [Oscillospiraceae bacterium]|nr:amidohydrolase family protein [Oscillospiraceae bacterium]